jgi:fructose-bisphosphate aldolase class I
MNANILAATISALLAPGKGLLAMDESPSTCNARFAALAIPETREARRAYRELLVTTPGLSAGISGGILADETIRQRTKAGVPFVDVLRQANIIPGIKVDLGAHELAGFAGEVVTEGLDGLGPRLAEYAALGARFAKWRAVLAIGPAGLASRPMPTRWPASPP